MQGLFIQEDASAALPAPGQHANFGAQVSWQQIHRLITPGRKLLLLIRHGDEQYYALLFITDLPMMCLKCMRKQLCRAKSMGE